jgi:magnesium-transporting ATPase (P-type)
MQEQADDFGGEGERLIAVAERFVPLSECPPKLEFRTNPPNFPTDKLCLLGLVSVMDPPRADVAACVRDCHAAGIQVSMVTGDHQSTATAIARMVGIVSSPPEQVLSWEQAKLFLAGQLPAPTLASPAAANTTAAPAGGWVGVDPAVGHGPVHRRRNRIQNYALAITGAEIRSFVEADWNQVFRCVRPLSLCHSLCGVV